jgi:hypothetical protein
LGKVPEEHPTEGISLSLEQGGAEFDEEAGGRVMLREAYISGTGTRLRMPARTFKGPE